MRSGRNELPAARGGSRAGPQVRGRANYDFLLRCQSGHGLAAAEGGAAASAADNNMPADAPATREDWTRLMPGPGVKSVPIDGCDTRISARPKPPAPSRTPCRPMACCPKDTSPPSWAGAATKSACRRTATPSRPAAAARSGSTAPARILACEAGAPASDRSSALSSRLTRPSRSRTTIPWAAIPWAAARRPNSAPPAAMPTIPATPPSCGCTRSTGRADCPRRSTSSRWTRS